LVGLRSVLEFRSLIMPEVARLAAKRITSAELEAVETLVEQIERCGPSEVHRFQDLDFEFHHTMARAGENLALLLILNSVRDIYRRMRDDFSAIFTEAPAGARRLYRAIAEALREGDEVAAERHCRRLMDDGNAALWSLVSGAETDSSRAGDER
jgi:DNA-binding FadR family transcriptional regulator